MAMRLQELHPSVVHFPIALLPLSLGADTVGRLTGSKSLMEMGKLTMPLAAAGAAIAGIFGLIAQEVVQTDEAGEEMLVTHRTLNLGLIGMTGVMAVKRVGSDRPGGGYLAAGGLGLAAMLYSAYLGGQMVYDRGVGVRRAGGLLEEEAPPLTRPIEATTRSARHVVRGAQHMAEDTAAGRIAPTLVPR